MTRFRVPTAKELPSRTSAFVVALVAVLAGTLTTSGRPAPPRPDELADAAPTAPDRRDPGADGGAPPVADPPPGDPPVAVDGGAGGVVVIPVTATGTTNGIPSTVLAAYRGAAETTARVRPGCHLPTTLLAAIGKVESGHARGGRVDATGTTVGAILGPVLNGGPGVAAIRDTDGGRLDGDQRWDRAVGPMQFIPGTWARWATDGNADRVANPHNVWDAAATAAEYLCAGGRDLATAAGARQAILSYNHSTDYLRLVLAWQAAYERGTAAVPDGTGSAAIPGAALPMAVVPVAVTSPTGADPAGAAPGIAPPGTTPVGTQPGGQQPGTPPPGTTAPAQPDQPAQPGTPTTPPAPAPAPDPVGDLVDDLDCLVDELLPLPPLLPGLLGPIIGTPTDTEPCEHL